jgi:hypothetical protein
VPRAEVRQVTKIEFLHIDLACTKVNTCRQFVRVVAASVFGLALIACSSEQQMRTQLLEKTPIGSSFDQVLAYCSKINLKCFQSSTSGYLNQATGKVVGVRSIWAVVDEHKDAPLKIASIALLPIGDLIQMVS